MTEQVPSWVNDYVGIDFVDNGRAKSGSDCWGLTRLIYKDQFGIELPCWAEGYDCEDIDSLLKTIEQEAKEWSEVAKGSESIGDVLILRVFGKPCHVGMYVGDDKMIHTHKGHNSVVEKLSSVRWRDRIAKIYRYDPTHKKA